MGRQQQIEDNFEKQIKETDNGLFYKFGAYQKWLCLWLFISGLPNAFSGLQFVVTHYTPTYHCSSKDTILQQVSNTSSINWNITAIEQKPADSCSRYNITEDFDTLNEEWSKVPCENIYFDGPYVSVVTEFGMVCDKAWQKPLAVSLYMFGKMIGSQFGGFLSDRYGRRNVFLASTLWQFVSSFLTSFSPNFAAYAVMIFLSGSSAVVNFISAILLGTEVVEPKYRKLMYFCVEMGFAVGLTMLPLAGYLITDWRWFLRFASFIGVFYIPYYWIINDTPVWLIKNGKIKETKRVLEKIAKVNKIKLSCEINDLINKEEKPSHPTNNSTTVSDFIKLCKSPLLVWWLTVSAYIWVVVSMTWYVIALNSDSLSGNRFINLVFGGLIEIVSTVCFFIGSATLGGRNAYALLIVTAGILIAATPLCALWSASAVLVATLVGRLMTSICYNLVYSYTNEIFPTNIRQSVLGFTDGMSRIGTILSPYIIYVGENGNSVGPSLGIGIALILSSVLSCTLPDGKDKSLPNTVEEALARNSGMLACCKRTRKHRIFLKSSQEKKTTDV